MKRALRIIRDESGMTYVFIGMGMAAFLSATMLAIDVGMLMTARNQAQNAADAGALAGATALIYDDYANRTASGPAITNAVNAAVQNQVMAKNVSVVPTDVEFLNGPSGAPNRVRVTVRRSASRGNPVSTQIARYFGVVSSDIGAVATAEASTANAMTCVKPFTIPDRWIEKQTPPWDEDDGFDVVDKKGKPVANADVYYDTGKRNGRNASLKFVNYLGFFVERMQGNEVVGRITPIGGLREGNGSGFWPAPAAAFPKSIRLVE